MNTGNSSASPCCDIEHSQVHITIQLISEVHNIFWNSAQTAKSTQSAKSAHQDKVCTYVHFGVLIVLNYSIHEKYYSSEHKVQ